MEDSTLTGIGIFISILLCLGGIDLSREKWLDDDHAKYPAWRDRQVPPQYIAPSLFIARAHRKRERQADWR
jgi:hypothetical protein